MEQGVVSIVTSAGMVDNSVGKPKNISISLTSNGNMQATKEKLKASWLSNLLREDATVWEMLILGVCELIGTAILVFVGCTGCIGSLGTTPSMMQISLTFGFAVMIAIQVVGHISGAHINPSITIATMVLGKTSLPMALMYIFAQCLGSLTGYGLLKLITPGHLVYVNETDNLASFCATDVNEQLSGLHGFAAEVIATALLVLFACGIWDQRNAKNTDSVSLRFGLCVTVLCFIFIPYTGCSLNPARSLGPAIWNNYWANHWVYWIGPFFGAILASLFYRCVLLSDNSDKENLEGI